MGDEAAGSKVKRLEMISRMCYVQTMNCRWKSEDGLSLAASPA